MTVEKWPRWADLPEFHALPDGWRLAYLTEVAEIVAGQSPPSETYNQRGDGLPFLQGCAQFGDEHPVTTVWCSEPSKRAPSGSTLMSVRAPVGDINRANQEYAIGRGLAALVATAAEPDFLYYGLHRWRASFQRLGQGSTFEAVTARQLRQVVIALPSERDEQRRIAGALRLTDHAIAKAREELDSARNLNRSLEDGLLTGQLDPRGRSKTKTRAGDLPQGWSVSPLKTLAEIGSGITLNQDRAAKENACRYLTVAHIQRGAISDDDPRFLELSDAERKHRLLETGDVLVVEGHASSMEIGRAALFEDQGEPTTFQNHLFRVRADRDQILPKFLLHILNSERVQRHWNAVCNTSSGLNTINRRNLRNMLVQHPDTNEQQKIIDALDAAARNSAQVAAKVRALEDLKRSLLQNLLTGKIRVPEGAIHA